MEHGRELEGIVIADRYLLESCIDEGNFGWVFKAQHQLLGEPVRTVAIKVTKATDIGRAEAREVFQEAVMLARLSDQTEDEQIKRYLVQVYDLGILPDHDARGFIVMEFISGGNLEKILHSTRMPQWDMMEYALEICRGMSGVHELGVVHRDLKPDNILLTSARQVKVGDFGLAAQMLASRGYVPGVAGTTLWMAPETMDRSDPRSDPRSDVYSIGLILYRMLTGKHPFSHLIPPRGLSPDEEARWLHEQRNTLVIPPPSDINTTVDAGMDEIVMAAMAPTPTARYPNAGALLKALEEFLDTDEDPRRELIARANAAASDERWEDAARLYRECIGTEPEAEDEIAFRAHRGLGRSLIRLERCKEAVHSLQEAEQINDRRHILKAGADIRGFYSEIADALRAANNPLAATGYDLKVKQRERG